MLNPVGEPLPVRTFYNHTKAIKEIFDLEITQSKGDRKYRVTNYYGKVQEEIVSYLSLNATINRYKDLRGRVLGEEEPRYKPREYVPRVLLKPVTDEIDKWLKENDKRRSSGMRKQCLKRQDIHRQLLEKG